MKDLFTQLGFSDTEILAFLALAETGKASAGTLAKQIDAPRSSTYSALQSLLARGVISVDQQSEPTTYLPLPPEALSRMVERERQQQIALLDGKKLAAEKLEELLGPFYLSKNFSIPRIQFFEGRKAVESMLYTYDQKWQESIHQYDATWWGYQDHRFVEQYRVWLDDYWARMKVDEKILLLSNEVELERTMTGVVRGRKIKPLPKNVEFSSTIWVLGDFVVLIMSRQTPHYAFQLEDAVFAANQREVFRFLWSTVQEGGELGKRPENYKNVR